MPISHSRAVPPVAYATLASTDTFPVAARSGPHYAAATELAGPGTYHLTYIVSPPSAHGMLRQTDKAGGVPDWWKPINASWTFAYPQNKN